MPRVLGVDPGLTRCGIGVVDGELGRRLRLVAVEVVGTPSGEEPATRLRVLHGHISRLVGQHRPDTVAVERVFADVNVMTVMGTAQAAAVAMLVAAEHDIPVRLHTPTEVKAAVTGNGRADKAQVTTMVTRLLALPERPRPADAADALALAICQVWRGGADARLAEAAARHEAARQGRRPSQGVAR